MIVKKHGDELLLMRQTDHAELAGRIARMWGNRHFDSPSAKEESYLATERHDDGWAEPDATPLLNEQTRRPLHFRDIPIEDHVPLYRRGVLSVAESDPYAGLLVGMHWAGLYQGRWGMQSRKGGLKGRSAEAEDIQDAVVLEEEERWARVKRRLIAEADRRSRWESHLWHSYELLQVWDLMSLFVCMAPHDTDVRGAKAAQRSVGLSLDSLQQPAAERVIPSPTLLGEDLANLVLKVKEPGVVTIDPYPFAEPEFSLALQAIAVPDQDYASPADVVRAWENATPREVGVTFTST